MTWQTFFDFCTMAHRHLVFVYIRRTGPSGRLPRLDRLELAHKNQHKSPLTKTTKLAMAATSLSEKECY